MTERHSPQIEVAIIGGDGRGHDLGIPHATFRSYPSPRYAGNGTLHRAVAAVGGGTIHLVVMLVRWLGHSDFRRINGACKAADVPVLLVAGGISAARREVQLFLDQEQSCGS